MRVESARNVQSEQDGWGAHTNASVVKSLLDATLALTREARELLSKAVDELALSSRGVNRVARVARTIADLGASKQVCEEHIGEALMLRMFDGQPGVIA